MARITVEDCLKRVPNRYTLVNMASNRVRQIREGSEYLVSSPKNEDVVVALREIAAGLAGTPRVGSAQLDHALLEEARQDQQGLVAIFELMFMNSSIRNIIRRGN